METLLTILAIGIVAVVGVFALVYCVLLLWYACERNGDLMAVGVGYVAFILALIWLLW